MPTTTTRRRLTGPMSLRLRHAREDKDLSRRAIAELVGMSERAVNYYENPRYSGARKAVYVRRWAEVTGREFEELYGTPDQPLRRTGCSNRTAGQRPQQPETPELPSVLADVA